MVKNRIKGNNSANNDELLYKKLCKLLKEEELWRNPLINREILADIIVTNRTYLVNAVKKHANGMTLSEFVNTFRLNNAARMLSERKRTSITEIGYESGFNSRNTFNRQFKQRYGMTPTEFRHQQYAKRLSQRYTEK